MLTHQAGGGLLSTKEKRRKEEERGGAQEARNAKRHARDLVSQRSPSPLLESLPSSSLDSSQPNHNEGYTPQSGRLTPPGDDPALDQQEGGSPIVPYLAAVSYQEGDVCWLLRHVHIDGNHPRLWRTWPCWGELGGQREARGALQHDAQRRGSRWPEQVEGEAEGRCEHALPPALPWTLVYNRRSLFRLCEATCESID